MPAPSFLYAFRALERGIVPRHEAVWLTKIAENVCRSRRRSLLRRAPVESSADVATLEDARPAADHPDELDGRPRRSPRSRTGSATRSCSASGRGSRSRP